MHPRDELISGQPLRILSHVTSSYWYEFKKDKIEKKQNERKGANNACNVHYSTYCISSRLS